MGADGENLENLTEHPGEDIAPDWFDPAAAQSVSPAGKFRGTWGWLKRNSQ